MITLHLLQQSRALRILWLLELLDVPYQVKIYQRNSQSLFAPEELKQVHPLGKSPLLEDNGKVFAESAVITDYLIQTYGKGELMPARNDEQYWDYQRWLHYAEASLMPLMLFSLVFHRIDTNPQPFFVKPITKKITDTVKKGFIHPQVELHLSHIEQELAGKTWFMGDKLTGADIMMSFPLQAAKSRFGLANYPNIQAYLQRIDENPAYQRAVEKAGQPIVGL